MQPHPHSWFTNLVAVTVYIGICLTTVGSFFKGTEVRLPGLALTVGPALLLAVLCFIATAVVNPASNVPEEDDDKRRDE